MARQPHKRNQTSFSSTHQPPSNSTGEFHGLVRRAPEGNRGKGRVKGRRNKKTEAMEAFAKMGYNPTEVQVALALQISQILEKGEDDDNVDEAGNPKKLTMTKRCQLIRQLAELNDKLMQYQSSKAAPEIEEYTENEDGEEVEEEKAPEGTPLNNKQLMEARKIMAAKQSLSSRFG